MEVCDCIAKLQERWQDGAYACVGLDSDFKKLPLSVTQTHAAPEEAVFVFNRDIVDATAQFASAFKPNAAFYEALGDAGHRALKRTVSYIHEQYPEIPVIFDAKRGDIGNTMEAYADAVFNELEMDAVTIQPYLGREAAQPFLDRKDRGVFVLAKTSNPGSGEFQDLQSGGEALYKIITQHVAQEWNANGNCGIVAGATYPEELSVIRSAAGEMPLLVPGAGAQGGDVSKIVHAGKASRSFGIVLNASRSIIFASSGEDYADAAGKAAAALSEEISAARTS